jgi:uncharacterized membrane protein
MVATLKILHFLAFSIGIGGGLANMLAGMIGKRADVAAKPALGKLQARIGLASALALVVLWITGIWLVVARYPQIGALPLSFWLKMAAVVALTATAAKLQLNALAAGQSGTPPPAAQQKWLGMLATLFAVVAVIFAALAFTAA